MKDPEELPITPKELFAWGGAAVTVLSLIVAGVTAFTRLEGRCDLAEQSVTTLRDERTEERLARDKQTESLNNRCNALEHNFAELTHSLADLSSRLAVMQSRQDDALELLKKIDAKVNGHG